MDDIVFNLTIVYDQDPDQVGRWFWNKYERCLEELRESCSSAERFHGYRITDNNLNPRFGNLIFELLHDDDEVIVISIKYERASVYFIAWRHGRGDPDAADPNNNEPWQKCQDFKEYDIPGAVKATFNGRYEDDSGENNFGAGNLGVPSLREAVVNLWFNQHRGKSFRSLCVHVAEPTRYECISFHFKRVIKVNINGPVEFTTMMKNFIKNWKVVSKAIQEHLNSKDEKHQFVIQKPGFEKVTFASARLIIAILKRYVATDKKEDN